MKRLPLIYQICEALGLPEDAPADAILDEIRRLRNQALVATLTAQVATDLMGAVKKIQAEKK